MRAHVLTRTGTVPAHNRPRTHRHHHIAPVVSPEPVQ